MDYIIIALWGLLTGAFLASHSGKGKNDVPSQQPPVTVVVDNRNNQLSPSEYEIIPVQTLVSNQDIETINTNPDNQVSVQEVAATQNMQTNSIFNKTKKAKKEKTKKVKEPKIKKEKVKHKSLSFSTDKVLTTVSEYEEVAVIPIPSVGLSQVAAEDSTLNEKLDDSQTSIVITDPLFEPDPTPSAIQETITAEAETTPQTVRKATGVKLPKNLKIEQLLCGNDGKPIRHKLKRGESLTQLAQRYYADSRFWPYIFEVNRYQLSKPDRVQSDMRLYLPDPDYYKIDGNSKESIERAKILINKYSK